MKSNHLRKIYANFLLLATLPSVGNSFVASAMRSSVLNVDPLIPLNLEMDMEDEDFDEPQDFETTLQNFCTECYEKLIESGKSEEDANSLTDFIKENLINLYEAFSQNWDDNESQNFAFTGLNLCVDTFADKSCDDFMGLLNFVLETFKNFYVEIRSNYKDSTHQNAMAFTTIWIEHVVEMLKAGKEPDEIEELTKFVWENFANMYGDIRSIFEDIAPQEAMEITTMWIENVVEMLKSDKKPDEIADLTNSVLANFVNMYGGIRAISENISLQEAMLFSKMCTETVIKMLKAGTEIGEIEELTISVLEIFANMYEEIESDPENPITFTNDSLNSYFQIFDNLITLGEPASTAHDFAIQNLEIFKTNYFDQMSQTSNHEESLHFATICSKLYYDNAIKKLQLNNELVEESNDFANNIVTHFVNTYISQREQNVPHNLSFQGALLDANLRAESTVGLNADSLQNIPDVQPLETDLFLSNGITPESLLVVESTYSNIFLEIYTNLLSLNISEDIAAELAQNIATQFSESYLCEISNESPHEFAINFALKRTNLASKALIECLKINNDDIDTAVNLSEHILSVFMEQYEQVKNSAMGANIGANYALDITTLYLNTFIKLLSAEISPDDAANISNTLLEKFFDIYHSEVNFGISDNSEMQFVSKLIQNGTKMIAESVKSGKILDVNVIFGELINFYQNLREKGIPKCFCTETCLYCSELFSEYFIKLINSENTCDVALGLATELLAFFRENYESKKFEGFCHLDSEEFAKEEIKKLDL